MDSLPSQKKGLSPLAWIGIGCAGLVGLAILAVVLASVFFGDTIKEFVTEMDKNPTRAAAAMMVKVSAGQFEFVAEDDANKRYTVREKKTGKRTTIYLDPKTGKPAVVEGDFTAIPAVAEGNSGAIPAAATPSRLTPP